MGELRLPRTCPACGKDLDLHESTTGRHDTPKPGDLSLCWGCGSVGVYTESAIRRPTDDEQEWIGTVPEVQNGLAALGFAWASGADPFEAVEMVRRQQDSDS